MSLFDDKMRQSVIFRRNSICQTKCATGNMSKCINTMWNVHPEENMFNKIDDTRHRCNCYFQNYEISCYKHLKLKDTIKTKFQLFFTKFSSNVLEATLEHS
jgi:hypothetical protein